MEEFDQLLREGTVFRAAPNLELASGLMKIALQRFENLPADSQINDNNSFQVIENAYEAVKELIDALMAIHGFKSYSHDASISFMDKFYKLPGHIINNIGRYKKKRNDIKYRGVMTSAEQGIAAKKDLKEAFATVESLVKKKLK